MQSVGKLLLTHWGTQADEVSVKQSESVVSKVTMKETEKVGAGDTRSQLPVLENDTWQFLSQSVGHTSSHGSKLREA